jgi:predicted metalloprotease with PDZ domain
MMRTGIGLQAGVTAEAGMKHALAVAIVCASLTCFATTGESAQALVQLEVDATDVIRGIQHAHEVIPVRPGSLTLAYPKWIPGEHTATGPLTQIVGLQISAHGSVLAWRRDSLDPFILHVDVPRGASAIELSFDYLSPPKTFGSGYGESPGMTPHLLILPFNQVLFYPPDASADAIQIKASVKIPAGWQFDSALRPERASDDTLAFPATSLSTLVDSPLLAGKYFRTVPLTEGEGGTRLSVAAEQPADIQISDEMKASLRNLVVEANSLFGARHYREYVWLFALDDRLEQNGLEHHESTDIRDTEKYFSDPSHVMALGSTIPHEYVHSWNGKYRRPNGLATRNYQQPMVDDLLWVYEGLTQYLGDFVLRGRSGLRTADQQRSYVAVVAATLDHNRPGRTWRSLADTAMALPGYNDAPSEWKPIRRGLDYYNEMLLVWLDIDTLLRERTAGARSLDDFCKNFFGGGSNPPAVRPYNRADVVAGLTAIAPYDWSRFLATRVDDVNPRAPLDGILRSGWSLTYDDTPNEFLAAREKAMETDDLSFSLGIWTKADGTVADVVHGSPAFAAGVAPGMRLVAIAGRKWTIEAARDAVERAEKSPEAIDIVLEAGNLVRSVRVDYHEGLRYPHLVRVAGKADLLSKILAPRAGQ